jgi:hypothetical protein
MKEKLNLKIVLFIILLITFSSCRPAKKADDKDSSKKPRADIEDPKQKIDSFDINEDPLRASFTKNLNKETSELLNKIFIGLGRLNFTIHGVDSTSANNPLTQDSLAVSFLSAVLDQKKCSLVQRKPNLLLEETLKLLQTSGGNCPLAMTTEMVYKTKFDDELKRTYSRNISGKFSYNIKDFNYSIDNIADQWSGEVDVTEKFFSIDLASDRLLDSKRENGKIITTEGELEFASVTKSVTETQYALNESSVRTEQMVRQQKRILSQYSLKPVASENNRIVYSFRFISNYTPEKYDRELKCKINTKDLNEQACEYLYASFNNF